MPGRPLNSYRELSLYPLNCELSFRHGGYTYPPTMGARLHGAADPSGIFDADTAVDINPYCEHDKHSAPAR